MVTSLALLLISLPHTQLQIGRVVGLDFGNTSLAIAFWGLAVASTYTFVNLCFEWENEALATYRARTKRLKLLRERVDEAILQFSTLREEVRSGISELLRALADRNRRLLISDDPLTREIEFKRLMETDDFLTVVRGHISSWLNSAQMRHHLPDRPHEVWPNNSAEERIQKLIVEGAMENMPRLLDALAEKMVDSGLIVASARLEQLDKAAADLGEKAQAVIETLERARDVDRALVRPLQREGRMVLVRSFGLGLVLPACLYTIGLAHFLGRLGISIGQSWIVLLLEHGPSFSA